MLVADRLGGPTAAALAPYFAFQTGAAPAVLYDTSLMAFFGTVLLIQCVAAAIERPPMTFIALLAVEAAVIAEVHLTGVMAFLSVVWVAVLHPPDRVRRVAMATMVFVVAVLIISPKTIAWNLLQLVSRPGAVSGDPTPSGDALPLRLHTATAALGFSIPWMIHWLGRSQLGRPPRGLHGAVAVCVPLAVAYSIGVLAGAFPTAPHSKDHYFEHAIPAMALVLAVPLAAIASTIWQSAASLLAAPAYVRRAPLWIVPLFLSLNAAVDQPGPLRPQPHWDDVQALARLLHDDWQWDWPTVDTELRSPEKRLLLQDLSAAVPDWDTAGRMAVRRTPQPVALIEVDPRRVPDPLPSGWIMVSRRTFHALLGIPMPSSLQWDAQTACLEDHRGHETCFPPPVDRKLLWTLDSSRLPEIRRLVRRVPWRGTAGTVESIVIPDLVFSCPGRIVQGPPGTEIDDGGRSARLTTSGEVIFEWVPNTQSCSIWDFLKQDDPFVIAGEPDIVESIARLVDHGRP
jgi:hypothetical protein